MANWEISRRPLRQSGPALLVILAVGTSTLALAQYESWRQSVRTKPNLPRRTSAESSCSQRGDRCRGPPGRRAAGVTSAVPVSKVSLGGTAQLLVMGTPQAASTVTLRSDLSGLPERQLFADISAGSGAGLALPGKPERLQILASMAGGTGGQLGPVSATAIVQDAYGLAYQVTTGQMPADGRWHDLVAQLAASPDGAAYPLRLIGLSLNYDMPAFPTSRHAVDADAAGLARFGAISVSPAATGTSFTTAATGQALGTWTRNISDNGLQAAEGVAHGAGGAVKPAFTTVRAVRGAEQVGFETGYGPIVASPAPGKSAFGVMPAELELDIPAAAQPVPVIATRGYAEANALGNSIFPVTIGGVAVSCTVLQTVTSFPAGGSLVASQSAVERALTSMGDGGTLPALNWWLATNSAAAPKGLPPGTYVLDAAADAQSLQRNPLSAAPVQAALAVAAAAALLAALGFCVSVAASARSRRSQRALLAALGVPASAQARQFCLEEIMVSGPAAVVGLAVGVGLAKLLIPSITLTATAGLPDPPVLVTFPVVWVAAVALLAPAIPVIAAAITTMRQPDPAAELRASEAAG